MHLASYFVHLFPLVGDLPKEPRTLTLDPNGADDLCYAEWGPIEQITLHENFVAIAVKDSQKRFCAQKVIVIWDWNNGQRLAVSSQISKVTSSSPFRS